MARPLEQRWIAARAFDCVRHLSEERYVQRSLAAVTPHATCGLEVAVPHHDRADAIEIVEAADEVARGERGEDHPIRCPEKVPELRAMAGEEVHRVFGFTKAKM